MTEAKRSNLHRIHGSPEQWLEEFLRVHSSAYKGRVTGVCVHMEVKCEDDPDARQVICWKDWDGRAGLIGHLTVTIQQLADDLIE